MRKYFKVFITIFTLIVLFSCSPKKNIVYLSNYNFEQEVSEARYTGLHIQEGDQLNILVSAFDEIAVRPFNMNTMSRTSSAATGNSAANPNMTAVAGSLYTVNSDGTIIFPVLGSIYCKGMTKQQLKDDLELRLKRYLTDPLVTVNLANFNFFVLGEVGSKGLKTAATEKVNILQALAIAGDINVGGNKTNVKLIRYSEKEGKDNAISLDLTDAGIVNSPYYYIQQNDIIYVEPDKNQQIAVNNSAKLDKALKYVGVVSGVLALFITILRIK
ncbi:polysaccharide biosynthesis/export family protein [Chryseobacterium koreense]|uniref:Sugar transporter n=1 Tax=Chryseobacterium koreense CCUG 49689 TaxID=1304281 RepID=A0A0J7LMT4_9FLAO|nr:polysaccharide biosynthesis/export family protein [Chryseobacterium koreense]KMQ70410.1 sugar transporter [Chryseobacterium koreense CCUG 49689]MBB5333565.1 polysaccharide export outer membrane protein [Chryseobacterium koreense]